MLDSIKNWWYQDELRSKALRELSTANQLHYHYDDEYGLIEYMDDFQLFKYGRRRRISHIIRNSKEEWEDPNIRVFDYKFSVKSGKASVTYKQTVFFMHSKQLTLPHFYMKPENFFHKVGKFFGRKDINFETHPEFSKQYWLRGKDEDLIRDAMNEDVLNYFTHKKNWYLEGLNYFILFYKLNVVLAPNEIINFYNEGVKLANMITQKRQ